MTTSHVSVIIILITLVFYIFELLPAPVIAMGSTALMVLFRVAPASSVWAVFGQDSVLLMGGMTLTGSTLFSTGAIQKLSAMIERATGGKVKLSIFAILLTAGLFSPFMNNTTVTVIFIPLILGIVARERSRDITEQKYIQALVCVVSVSGLATLIGTGTTIAASSMMENTGYGAIGFFDFLPIAAICFVITMIYVFTAGSRIADWMVARNPYRSETVHDYISEYEKRAKASNQEFPVTRQMIISIAIMLLTVTGLITSDVHGLGLGTVAILGGLACIITGCIPFKVAMQKISWETLLILGGTIGCGSALASSGGGALIATSILSVFGDNLSPYGVFVVMTLMSGILGQVLSNTATVGIFIPISVAICEELGISPLTTIYGITIASTLTFATPMSSHLHAMIIDWGSYRFVDYLTYSGPINALLLIIILILLPILYPIVPLP